MNVSDYTSGVVAIAACVIIKKRQKQKRLKRIWVDPFVEKRTLKGAFVTLYSDLREHPRKFFNYFRMSTTSFDELYVKLEHSLKHRNVVRLSISATERLCVALRYLASGNTFTDLHYTYRLGISTISGIVEEVCTAIWILLKEETMKMPCAEKWEEISLQFQERANFPNCIGAVDGKHIRIVKPTKSGSLCYNYKHFFSVILMAICDANYSFIYIDVGAYGKFSDSTVFKSGPFWQKLENNSLNIPPGKPLPMESISVPYVIVGDEAFPLTKNLLRPYARKNLNYKKKIFNYRLTRARRNIECTFGILSNKWRIFHRPLNVSVSLSLKIIKACCILHNFVRTRDGFQFEDTLTVQGFQDLNQPMLQNAANTNQTRDIFANYFVGPGTVPWQDRKIH